MHTLFKLGVVAVAPVLAAAVAASSAEATTLAGAGTRPLAMQTQSLIEPVACNGTWGKYCGPGQHRVCTADGCGCVACGARGAGYGYGTNWGPDYGGWYGGAGWYNRGWHRHFWHHGNRRHHGVHHHFHHHHAHHHHHHGHHGGHHHSDIRLKTDIVALARLDNGLELCRFRYKGADRTAYVGVMAQDVAKIDPAAVSRDADGYLSVDYDRLGLDFLTWDEYVARNGTKAAGPAASN